MWAGHRGGASWVVPKDYIWFYTLNDLPKRFTFFNNKERSACLLCRYCVTACCESTLPSYDLSIHGHVWSGLFVRATFTSLPRLLPLVRSLLRLQTRQPMPRPFEGSRLTLKKAKGHQRTGQYWTWFGNNLNVSGLNEERLRSSCSHSWMCLSDLLLQMQYLDRSGRHFSDFHSGPCIAAWISSD